MSFQSDDRQADQERQEPELAPRDTVGFLLRDYREAHGYDIGWVAQQLRIRQDYLEAIEEGRLDGLPGPAYAVGFVRSYSQFLGLDPDSMVAHFKSEAEGLDQQRHLNFPAPVHDSRFPGGMVMLVAVLLIVAGYGGWYLVNSEEEIGELVAPLPESIKSAVERESETVDFDETPEAAIPEPRSNELASMPQEAGGDSARLARARADDPPAAPAVEAAGEQTAASQPASEPPLQPAAPDEAASPPEDAARDVRVDGEQPAEDAGAEAPSSPESASETPAPEGPPPAPPVREADAGGGAEEGRIYGGTSGDSRIVLRVTSESWIQVRNAEGDLLFTRVLRPGDRYRVPVRDGLTMLTNNAGGIDVLVDGEAAPSLGPVGLVRRRVVLDPMRLMAGEAVER